MNSNLVIVFSYSQILGLSCAVFSFDRLKLKGPFLNQNCLYLIVNLNSDVYMQQHF